MARRGLLVLAIIAALIGAPRTVSAAANALGSPSATPSTGSTETVFVLQVSYDGQFPASGVTAAVATRLLAMSLIAGSATSGTWSAATTVPAGTWPVVFTATTLQGNVPALSAMSLSVYDSGAPPSASTPARVPNAPRTEAGGEAPASGGGSEAPAPLPAQAPAASAPAATTDPVPATAPTAPEGGGPDRGASPRERVEGSAAPSAAPAPHEGPALEGPASDDAPGTVPGRSGGPPTAVPTGSRGAATPSPGGGALAEPAAPGPTHRAAGPAAGDASPPVATLLLGLSGVAAVALFGSAVLILGRRRRTRDGAALATQLATQLAARRGAGSEAGRARRARRLARAQLDDDPILASLGIGRSRGRPADGGRPGEPDTVQRTRTMDRS